MKKGDIVEIYEQPLSETGNEGKAKLIRSVKLWQEGMEIWRVEFLSDGFICDRAIKNKE